MICGDRVGGLKQSLRRMPLPPEEAADRIHLAERQVMLARDKEVRDSQQTVHRVEIGNGLVHC